MWHLWGRSVGIAGAHAQICDAALEDRTSRPAAGSVWEAAVPTVCRTVISASFTSLHRFFFLHFLKEILYSHVKVNHLNVPKILEYAALAIEGDDADQSLMASA